MKLSVDFRKPRVWLSTFILAAILAFFTIPRDQQSMDSKFVFIHITLSIVSLIAFMMNVWLPILLAAVLLPFSMWLLLTPNRMFFYGENQIAVNHLDISIYVLSIFTFIVISYLHRAFEKMLSEQTWKTLGFFIILLGLIFLPGLIQELLVSISGIRLAPPLPTSS